MNFTIDTTGSTNWKRFKTHYIAAIAGIALGAVAVVGAGELRDTSPTGEQAASFSESSPAALLQQDSVDFGSGVWDTTLVDRPVSVAQSSAVSLPSDLLVYIVGSGTEKRTLERDLATPPGWFGQSPYDIGIRIIVIEPGMEDSLETVDRLLPEAQITTGNGPSLKLVDMR